MIDFLSNKSWIEIILYFMVAYGTVSVLKWFFGKIMSYIFIIFFKKEVIEAAKETKKEKNNYETFKQKLKSKINEK